MKNLFFMSGLSYLVLIFAYLVSDNMISISNHNLLIVFSFPHFVASYWLWFKKIKCFKKEILPLIFPVIYVVIFYASFNGISQFLTLNLLLKLSYFYLLYHFAQQLFGVTIWLSFKFDRKLHNYQKLLLRVFFLFASFYSWIESEIRGVDRSLFYYPVSNWYLPIELLNVCFFLVLLSFFILAFWMIYDFLKVKQLKALIPLSCVGVGWIWFLPPMSQKIVFVLPVLHAVQYFPFVFLKIKNFHFFKKTSFILSSIFFGWVLFAWVPLHLSFLDKSIWPAMILSLLNNHHFLIDGRIWKLRDPDNSDLF